MDSNQRISRRRLLGAVGATGVVGLAGCSNAPTGSTPTGTAPKSGQPIRETSFEGESLVVQLADDHEVSRLNLIDPNDELFTQASVAQGQTTVRLQILDMGNYGTNAEHYPPGEYELLAIGEGESSSITLSLQPELNILKISQFANPESDYDYGKLTVEVRNIGTGPTWVNEISYESAPNFAANNPLQEDTGQIFLYRPKTAQDSIIQPKSTLAYTGATDPVVFGDSEGCDDGVFDMVVLVSTATSGVLRQRIRLYTSAPSNSVSTTSEYTCESIEVELVGDSTDE